MRGSVSGWSWKIQLGFKPDGRRFGTSFALQLAAQVEGSILDGEDQTRAFLKRPDWFNMTALA
jgi:hypothetical protein